MDSGDNISRAAVEVMLEQRMETMLRLQERSVDDPKFQLAYSHCHGEMNLLLSDIRSLPPSPVEGEGLAVGAPMKLDGLTPEERLVWLLGDLMNAAENFYGVPNPKREGHIYCAANRIIDEVIEPIRAALSPPNPPQERLSD